MKKVVEKLFKHPWLIIIVISIVTLFFITQLPRLKIDNNYFNFVPKSQPSLIATKKLEKQFGSQDMIDIAVEARDGSIITKEGILLVRKITDELSSVKNVDSVISISNSDFITGDSFGMEVIPLIGEDFNGSEEEIINIRQRLLSWELYRRNFISDDFSSTQIAVKLKKGISQDEEKDVYNSIESILSRYRDSEYNFYVAGLPALIVLISKNVNRDLITLIPFVLFVVLLILFLSFRRAGGVILPVLTVVISTIWTLGIMALLNVMLTIIGTIIPILLVAVGSAYGIHLINNYYDSMRKLKHNPTFDEHREIVIDTVRHVGMPVLLAAATTIVGFGSLAASRVVPMKNFGIFTAVGVAAAFIVAVTFIPSLLLIRHRVKKPDNGKKQADKMTFFEKLLSAVHGFIQIRPDWLIMGFLVVTGFSIYGSMHLIKDNVMIDYFRPKSGIVRADNFLRKKFSGTGTFDIVVRGKNPGDLTDPDVLKFMDDLSSQLKRKFPQVGKIVSFTDFIKLMNQAMNVPEALGEEVGENAGNGESASGSLDKNHGEGATESPGESNPGNSESTSENSQQGGNQNPRKSITKQDIASLINKAYARAANINISTPQMINLINRELNYRGAAYYEIPYDTKKYRVESREELKNLISQYLLLYSGNLSDWVDDAVEPSVARMQVLLLSKGTQEIPEMVKEVERFARLRLPKGYTKGYTVETAGNAIVQHDLTNLIVNGAIRSFLISLLAVLIILSIYYRSVIAGIFSIIPIGLTILINFGVMGFFGIRMDIATAMVGSIAVGIGIDYTIHFISAYRRERSKTANLNVVSHNVLLTTGKAIIFNAASVGAGFAVLIFSSLTPLMFLGILIALTMAVSSLSALTIIPFLLRLFKPGFILKKDAPLDKNKNIKGEKYV